MSTILLCSTHGEARVGQVVTCPACDAGEPARSFRNPTFRETCTHEGFTIEAERLTCDPVSVTVCLRCGKTVEG